METGIPGPNPCLTKLWDLGVPTWGRELANLSICGDLTSPDCSAEKVVAFISVMGKIFKGKK